MVAKKDSAKEMRLQDLFKTGEEVRFELEYEGEPVEILIWLRKPTAGQQEEALAKARGKQARRKLTFRDKDSDEFLAMQSDVESYESISELKDQLLRFESQQLRTQAFNEVLHDENFAPKDEDGENLWGEDNALYLDLLIAIQQRMEEIQQFNKDLVEGDDDELVIKFEEDEALVKLQKDRDEFETHVTDRYDDLNSEKMKSYDGKKSVDLRKLLLKKLIEADTSLIWYEEYRVRMLYFACRSPEDKTKPYFSNPRELLEIPPAILTYLENALDELDRPGEALKNLPSPLLSSDS